MRRSELVEALASKELLRDQLNDNMKSYDVISEAAKNYLAILERPEVITDFFKDVLTDWEQFDYDDMSVKMEDYHYIKKLVELLEG